MVHSTLPLNESRLLAPREPGQNNLSGSGQDNTVSSSAASDRTTESETSSLSTISASDISEDDFKSVIDLLEKKVSSHETAAVDKGGRSASTKTMPHSVEYWTVGGKGKPKALVKRYSVNRQSRRKSVSNKRLNNAATGIDSGNGAGDFVFGGAYPVLDPSLVSNGNLLPAASQCQPLGGQIFQQIPAGVPPFIPLPLPTPFQPALPLYMPPDQPSWTSAAAGPQLIPSMALNSFIQPGLLPFPQHDPNFTTPFSPNGFPGSASLGAPSYYQGAPLYYQIPSLSMGQVAPSFLANNGFIGFKLPCEYPPPPYEETPSGNETLSPPEQQQASKVELDTNLEMKESLIDVHFQFQNGSLLGLPNATLSSSDTSLGEINQSALIEGTGPASSGYGSIVSSPVLTASSSEIHSPVQGSTDEEMASGSEINEIERNMNTGDLNLGRFPLELHALNECPVDSCPSVIIPQGGAAQEPVVVSSNHEVLYQGYQCTLKYSLLNGNGTVISNKQKLIPFICNIFDVKAPSNFKEQCGPAVTFPYYVPPRTADTDYFGGQFSMWQLKMGQYFLKFQPHNWIMHGVPEIFNTEKYFGGFMDAIGEFHIVSKLRFSCRTCKTPWTSKKGTIVFKFGFNSIFQRGWILMKIFGQICMREECADWTFQNPACYPEEIDRASKKLSEYIGNQCYGIAVNPSCFDECFKSIRRSGNVGNNNSSNKEREKSNLPPTPHKREYCQACLNGVCKNLFAKPFMS